MESCSFRVFAPQERTRTSLAVQPVTEAYKEAFSALICEQAAQHSASTTKSREEIDTLWNAVGAPDGINAFLVVDDATQKPLAAVTYTSCVSRMGEGLYLEDIVTTKAERGHGIGSFAMSALAQLAQRRGVSYISWECAHSNHVAQAFYDGLKAERFENRHTWRTFGLMEREPRDDEGAEPYTVRRMTPADSEAVAACFSCQHTPLSGRALVNRDFVMAVAETCDREIVGAAVAYRNYSTFRTTSGLHLERVALKRDDPALARSILDYFAEAQRQKMWDGHVDFTIDNADTSFWTPVLGQYGMEPLSYGNDPMVVRRLSGDALAAVAEKTRHESLRPTSQLRERRLRTSAEPL
ncbi:MAG: GNAT family N-acetyltransferase [Alphaproteobacteria bacterium]|nr:GNAT family N-acetyltransferase [Alphaproteobacteria bacterium]